MSNAKPYEREKNGRRFILKGGMNTVRATDMLPEGEYAYLQNVRSYLGDRITGRNTQSASIASTATSPHSVRRLNDTTPAGPMGGFTIITAAGTGIYANSANEATGLSGNPTALCPFRPNTSVQPWMYVGDSAPYPNVTVAGAFNCAGMIKVRSDGLSRKTGIAEPQVAPTTSFPGGGSGPSQIFYYYTYRASETGAVSNPSPVSIPGTNSQSSPSATENAATGSVINPNYTVNGSQYEGNSNQIRTTGAVAAGTITDPIIATGFGPTLAIPTGVNIDGITGDLNWLGQNMGTGVLSKVSLYYLGNPIGNPKFPAIQNQSFATDTLIGGTGDTWGATLTPDIVNDPSFGIGWTITTQSSGGSDRSFINYVKMIASYSTQDAIITPTPSNDPQVDKIDIYRQGGGLANPTYIGTAQNTSAAFNDLLSDLGAATNPLLQFDNYEPFPSIDLPRKGTLNATGNVLTRTGGDEFNIRWLPGTIILIGNPDQVAYIAVRRPSSATSWDFTNNDPTVTPIPNGTGLIWNIAEPALAAQPLPSMWGPTDNSAYMFACYDPLRPGTLYYTKGNNPDSAPDTNQIEVTSPSEPLMNGYIIGGIGQVFSTERAWWIYPTFITALATVTGVQGQAFNLIESVNDRGLYIRNCLCTEAGKNGYFRAKDGIYISPSGQGSKSITDTIYNLFPHEQATGTTIPGPVTIGTFTVYPPDDTEPEAQKLSFAYGYLYYDYQDVNGNSRTLVYDVIAKGWSVDVYGTTVTVHAPVEGQANGTYVGCADGSIRTLTDGASENATSVVATGAVNNGDARAFKRLGDVFIRALVNASNPITVALYANQYNQLLSGFAPTAITGTGVLAPYIVDFSNGFGADLIDIAPILSWPTAALNYLDLWQPDFVPLPESTQDRPTDWGDLGSTGMNFVQGLILEADTLGAAKAIQVEDESGTLRTPDQSPITLNGQQKIALTFTPPFVSHIGRIVSTDGVPWRVWGAQWVSVPFPESTVEWQTEMVSFGVKGWMHIPMINIPANPAADITLTLVFDQWPTITLTIPNTSGALVKQKIIVPPNKFKMVSFRLNSTVPFSLFEKDVEVWVGEWGRSASYRILRPFGGNSSPGAAV